MESPEQKELERFIHEQLCKLPEREAPVELVQNVMKAIAARDHLPWWKQPFNFWPRRNQIFLFTALSAIFGGALYFAWSPAEQLTVGSLAERVRPFSWVVGVCDTFFSAMWVAARNMPWQWLAVIAAVFMIMYVASIAAGVALYRVASHRPASLS